MHPKHSEPRTENSPVSEPGPSTDPRPRPCPEATPIPAPGVDESDSDSGSSDEEDWSDEDEDNGDTVGAEGAGDSEDDDDEEDSEDDFFEDEYTYAEDMNMDVDEDENRPNESRDEGRRILQALEQQIMLIRRMESVLREPPNIHPPHSDLNSGFQGLIGLGIRGQDVGHGYNNNMDLREAAVVRILTDEEWHALTVRSIGYCPGCPFCSYWLGFVQWRPDRPEY